MIAAAAAVLLTACDAHFDFPDTAVKPGHILCTDGKAISYNEYKDSGKQAIAVVFHIDQSDDTEGDGYAVYLHDIAPAAFADSLGISQKTSADIMAMDGNGNTFAMFATKRFHRLWRNPSSTCGDTGRVPMSPRWRRCGCSIR